jgi:hypothetical protein
MPRNLNVSVCSWIPSHVYYTVYSQTLCTFDASCSICLCHFKNIFSSQCYCNTIIIGENETHTILHYCVICCKTSHFLLLSHKETLAKEKRNNLPSLKAPKCKIFYRSDFHAFYIIKSLRKGDFGDKIKKILQIFKGSSGASNFLRRMLSLILGRAVPSKHAEHIRIKNWCVPWAYGSGTDTHQFLTRMLSISVKIPNLKRAFKTCWSCTSGTDAHTEHTYPFLTHMPSISVKFQIWKGPLKHAERALQKLNDACSSKS